MAALCKALETTSFGCALRSPDEYIYKVLAASRPRSIVSDPKALFLGAECFAVICESSVICVVISCEAEPEQTLNYFEYVGTRKERWCSRKQKVPAD